MMFLAMAMRIEDAYTLTPMLALVGVPELVESEQYEIGRGASGERVG